MLARQQASHSWARSELESNLGAAAVRICRAIGTASTDVSEALSKFWSAVLYGFIAVILLGMLLALAAAALVVWNAR